MTNLGQTISEQIRNSHNRQQKINQFGCAAHILNLIVQKIHKLTKSDSVFVSDNTDDMQRTSSDINRDSSFNDIELSQNEQSQIASYKALIEKCRKITGFFHQSTQMAEILKEKQTSLNISNHKLIQDVQTR